MAANATSTPTPIDLNLIGAWALVIVALATVLVTAIQNRRTQKLMAQQTQVMGEQMKQSIAQTQLQQEQFAEIREEQERPRMQELIQKVLTPSIRDLLGNQGSFERKEKPESLLDWLEKGYSTVATLAHREFQRRYPAIAAEMRRYDEICTKTIQMVEAGKQSTEAAQFEDLCKRGLELSKSLYEKLEGLRDELGQQYNITRDDYFEPRRVY